MLPQMLPWEQIAQLGDCEGFQLKCLNALPERWVTVHSGDMGYTFGPLQGEQGCLARSVAKWMSG